MNLDTRKPNNKRKIFDFANIGKKFKSSGNSDIRIRSTSKSKGKLSDVKSSSSKGKSKVKRVLKRIAIIFSLTTLFGFLFGILFILALVSAYSKQLPDIDKHFAEGEREFQDTVITDRNGKELYRLQGGTIRKKVKLQDVPDKLEWAFLAAEDDNFWNHKGLDIFGVGRAVFCAAKNKGQAVCGGGSSITQQLIKNTTPLKENSITRKIKEAILAMQVEQKEYEGYNNSKEYILEFYLNIVPEGGILEGVQTGSEYHFGKSNLNDLTLAEMAFLASIPNEPPVLAPGGPLHNREKSNARAEYVLNRMLELKDKTLVTEEEIQKAKEELPKVVFKRQTISKKAPHYVDYVLSEVLSPMYKDKVEKEGQTGVDYLRGKGYTIKTAVDLETQELLEKTVKEQVESEEYQTKVGAKNAAAVIMDPRSGEILSIVGSRDYNSKEEDKYFSPVFNAATNSLRSMGSSVKPFTYLNYFMNGGANPSSILPNYNITYENNYAPYNYGQQYENFGGPFVTARSGLQWSLNIPAVGAFELGGKSETYADTYIKLHGNEEFRENVLGATATLGAANMRLIDQVHAYSTIANMGNYHEKISILEIKDNEGKVVYSPNRDGKQVIEEKYAYMINDMNANYWLFRGDLGGDPVLSGIKQSMYIGGKTGTSDTDNGEPGDLAFMAYTPTFVMGMWSGNSCAPNECPIVGGTEVTSDNLYKLVYKPFLEQYLPKIEPKFYDTVPAGLVRVNICPKTGRSWTEDCPEAAVSEWAADTALPKKEDMIQKVWVTQCGEELKLARQIDKDAKQAEEKKYVVYKFDDPWIQAQVTAYQQRKKELPPTEECDIKRDLKKPKITITSPSNNTKFEGNDVVRVIADISSEIGIQKVEVYLDNVLQKSINSAPYDLAFVLPKNIKSGKHKIIVVAQDKRGDATGEAREEIDIVVIGNEPEPEPTIKPTITTLPTVIITPTSVPVNLNN